MNVHTYRQETKNQVRHKIIRRAVETLTVYRSDACCVRNSYVRDVYDYFINSLETHEQIEAKRIDLAYVCEWEHMHTNTIGFKRPDELSVCYLSGPEPKNDFDEFVAMGVLPQNIWAFECEKRTYLQALASVDGSTYMQPKILKTSIERFFENSPKSFDIVYIDACASLISDKHALRCISSLFQNHRLNSPGVLISNFALFDCSNGTDAKQYTDIISRFNYIHTSRNACLIDDNGHIRFLGEFDNVEKSVADHLEYEYGNFVTSMICDAASVAIPSLRFCNSNYLQALTSTIPIMPKQLFFEDVNTIRDNTLYKFFACNCFLQQKSADFPGIERINRLMAELSGSNMHFDLLSSLYRLYELKTKPDTIRTDIMDTIDFFDNSKVLYQFLDKPNRVLFLDSVINQMSYPMHYVSDKILRYSYIAKEKRMFTDLLLFDECRYIYDWIPSIHQIPKAFSNPSWQYTFRFGLDGLLKQRLNYNNEFFFQGSVISKTIPGFEAQSFPERIRLN